MKTCPLVDNVCIYGDSTKSYVVALVSPNEPNLKKTVEVLGKEQMTLKEARLVLQKRGLTNTINIILLSGCFGQRPDRSCAERDH